MKISVTLSPKHTEFIVKYAVLTGCAPEEFVNWLLADYLWQFSDASFVQETIGAMTFKDRESAERVQTWLVESVSKNIHHNSIKTEIKGNADGTFEVDMRVPCAWDKSASRTIA